LALDPILNTVAAVPREIPSDALAKRSDIVGDRASAGQLGQSDLTVPAEATRF
jgi:hypothetical protein